MNKIEIKIFPIEEFKFSKYLSYLNIDFEYIRYQNMLNEKKLFLKNKKCIFCLCFKIIIMCGTGFFIQCLTFNYYLKDIRKFDFLRFGIFSTGFYCYYIAYNMKKDYSEKYYYN